MTKKEYNGWTNYETWLVKLWMDNDEGSYNHWIESAREIYDRARNNAEALRNLSTALRAEHEDIIHEALPERLHASFIMDLLNGAMSEVNWHEMAESLLNDHVEDYGKKETEAA